MRIALTELGLAERSRRGRVREPSQGSWWRSTAGLVVGVWLVGALACVDTSRRAAPDGGVGPGGVQPAVCQGSPPAASAGDAGIPTGDTSAAGPYAWKNVVIKGGGFVTGIVMSPALSGLAFARTDVGGAYRFDPADGRWLPITDWVGHSNSNLIGIESVAVDPVDPNRVYLAAGEYLTAGSGLILSSTDMGRTWTQNGIGAPMGGNVDGRSMGERLAVDPNLPSTLYFGSRNAGLWTSPDYGATWSRVTAFPTTGATGGGAGSGGSGAAGYGLTFVVFDPSSGAPGAATPAIYVGVGVTSGSALYRSTDAGASWQAVAGVPAAAAAMMPHHAVFDGCGNLYLAFNDASGPNNVTSGFVYRYGIASGTWTDVSPPKGAGGFGGLAADPAHPGTLLVTTIDRWSPDEIYRTTNGGATWTGLVEKAAFDDAGAAWLYFGGTGLSTTGWMGGVAIDPFDPAHALYVTGQGLWSSDDLTAADSGLGTHWTFEDAGLEQTVVLDLVSPKSGPPLLSGLGDLGGFRHDDLGVSPPGGMYTNPVFSNTNSLDFAEADPTIVVRAGTGGGTNGAWSGDGGMTWTPFPSAPSGSTGSGSIAVSTDGTTTTFLWAPKKGTPSYSQNHAMTWTASAGLGAGVQVAADRVNPRKFYATSRSTVYASTDGGATFVAGTLPSSSATPALGRPRAVFGVEGDVWVTTSGGLLHSQDSGLTYTAVAGVNGATAIGFGAPAAAGATYPAVYLAGSVLVAGAATYTWGTYRSDDAGASWQRIDDPQHQFGYLNCLAGDPRLPGRVYLGTSGRGIVYGDDPQLATATATPTQ